MENKNYTISIPAELKTKAHMKALETGDNFSSLVAKLLTEYLKGKK
jgi:hypothetical protein